MKPTPITPMPPVRPAHLPAATSKPPAVQAPAIVPAIQQNDPVAVIYPDHGPSLPPASRARMHQCGEEWRDMKASGTAADQTWRAFAQACLVR